MGLTGFIFVPEHSFAQGLRDNMKFRKVNNRLAKKLINNFILKILKEDIYKISISDIINNLKLPPEQIEKVMKELEKEKKVTEL